MRSLGTANSAVVRSCDTAKEHHQNKGSGKPTWNGIWAGMWTSPEWTAYKKDNNREECSDTHYNFSDKRL